MAMVVHFSMVPVIQELGTLEVDNQSHRTSMTPVMQELAIKGDTKLRLGTGTMCTIKVPVRHGKPWAVAGLEIQVHDYLQMATVSHRTTVDPVSQELETLEVGNQSHRTTVTPVIQELMIKGDTNLRMGIPRHCTIRHGKPSAVAELEIMSCRAMELRGERWFQP